jgi:hypothetical protein
MWCFAHRFLVSEIGYSQWKLGGFGMFSSINNPQTRYLLLRKDKKLCVIPKIAYSSIQNIFFNLTIDRENAIALTMKNLLPSDYNYHSIGISNCLQSKYFSSFDFGFIDFNLKKHVFLRHNLKYWSAINNVR